MANFSKLENVTLTYVNGRIEVKGKTLKASLVISPTDLKDMYFGATGHGSLNLHVNEENEK